MNSSLVTNNMFCLKEQWLHALLTWSRFFDIVFSLKLDISFLMVCGFWAILHQSMSKRNGGHHGSFVFYENLYEPMDLGCAGFFRILMKWKQKWLLSMQRKQPKTRRQKLLGSGNSLILHSICERWNCEINGNEGKS